MENQKIREWSILNPFFDSAGVNANTGEMQVQITDVSVNGDAYLPSAEWTTVDSSKCQGNEERGQKVNTQLTFGDRNGSVDAELSAAASRTLGTARSARPAIGRPN